MADSQERVSQLNQLCNSEFCRFLAALEFKPGIDAPDILERALTQRFPNERAFRELQIGQVKTIAARKDCPSCRFASAKIQSCARDETTPETVCFACFPKAHFHFNLAYHNSNGRRRYLMSKYGERITFLANDAVSCYEAGKLVDPDGLDYPRMTAWLKLCEKLHNMCPQITTGKSNYRRSVLPQLRVVDVAEMCLTEISWSERYVALSYVWGAATPPRLLKDELHVWKAVGSIQERWAQFPKSIRNSMEVVRRLGLRYFWFDSLCLLQDDLEELRKSINNMDIIYERAYVTIVAANGPSADGGLPGVEERRVPSQMIEHIKPGLSVVSIAPLDAHLKTSTWATRCWTLQEQHLSRRTLNFVNGQVYFRCRQRIWAEDTCRDLAPESLNTSEWSVNYIALAREGMDDMEYLGQPYDFLFSALEEFQRRNITMDNDALNAMAGFLQRVSEFGRTEMIEGFPAKLLPVAVLFRNRFEDPQFSRHVRRRMDFPSWSWAGWHSPCFWDIWKEIDITDGEHEIVDWLAEANWITWWVSKGGCVPRMIHAPASMRQEFSEEIAMERANLDSPTAAAAPPAPTQGASGNGAPPFPFLPQPARERDTAAKAPILTNLPYSLLVFQALSIRMRLGPLIANSYCRTQVLDNTGSPCGEVIPDFLPDLPRSEDEDSGVHRNTAAEDSNHNLPIREFAVLSERWHKPNINAAAPGDDEYDKEFVNLVTKNTCWVMMVEYFEEKGAYERRGIGYVLKSSIEKSFAPGPEWKEMILA